ncbi:hypothetical protein Leryth_021055 [Lithospermum erythrorhizon]|nr:hypothetical protein Leryth_021055 [Lithospermum erythrorhizon]
MESWSYISDGKGFVLDDSVSETGDLPGISKTGLMSSELKFPWSFDCNSMSSNQGGDQIQEFVDLDSSYMMRKSLPNDSIGNTFAGKISDGRVISAASVPPNDFSCEDDSSSMFSSSVIEMDPRDSSLIDLKLGRLSDQGDIKAFSSSVVKTNFSSSESSIPMKRARAGGLGSQTPYCQVHGCRKDLSSCKDYHKRHKVCEIHSKTTKVIVNGIEQRFCQQCSRFHLLAEFDDGKRSCRKRLAGHNERRRKPHIHIHAGRVGRLFQSSNTTRPEGSSLSASSFVCQDLLPTCHLRDHNNLSRLVKLEDGTNLRTHFNITDDVRQKSIFTQYTPEKQCHSVQDVGSSVMTKREINVNNSHLQDIADSSFDSRAAVPSFRLHEDMSVLDSSSTFGGLSDIANSGRALSLLSSQSQCSSMSTSGVPTVLPLVSSGSRALYGMKPHKKLLGMSSQPLTSGTSSAFSSSLLSSSEKNGEDNMLISNGGAGTYGYDTILHQSQSAYINSKNHFPFQQGSTINLLQLSTQLQRVQHQRQSSMMKNEDEDFSVFRNT